MTDQERSAARSMWARLQRGQRDGASALTRYQRLREVREAYVRAILSRNAEAIRAARIAYQSAERD